MDALFAAGDGHVLSFPGAAGAGRFDQTRWVVEGSGNLAGLHEAAHLSLNGMTAWGVLLQSAALTAAARPDQPDRRVTLKALVERCARTHEAYATQASLAAAGPDSSLDAYPEYRAHLRDAMATGPEVLIACMQADVLTTFLEAGPDRFEPSMLRGRDSPDHRLAYLLEDPARLRAEIDRSGPLAAELLLAEAGMATIGQDRLRSQRAQVIAAADGRAVLDDDPTAMFEAESIRMRPPRPARIRPLGELPPASRPLITVRAAGTLHRQFALPDSPWPADRAEPVVTARVRAGAGVDLFPVAAPVDLNRLDGPHLVSVAVTCARDPGWYSAWAPAFQPADTVTMLVDTPFAQTLTALLEDPAGFRWTIVGAAHLTVIVCAVGDYPPLLRVCSVPAAMAFRIHLGRRGKAREADGLADLSPRPRELAEIAARVTAEESLVDTLE